MQICKGVGMNYSSSLFSKAQQLIPGGVNSPVRAFKGVGGEPVFFKQGKGAYLIDVDDKHYIDYVGSWGPLILGHNHPKVKQAILEALEYGVSYGAPTELEVMIAEKITEIMPNLQKVRMVNSGTEATMTAIRLARGITGRDKIIKFEGCYHGHSDSLLSKAGSGLLTLGIPSSPGVPAALAQLTLTAPFNDFVAIEQLLNEHGNEVAAIIIEPIAGNMGCVLPREGYLQHIRQLCNKYGIIFIMDEVMTGFRVGLGGAQALYQVKPDITTLGKVIGGGMPVGALGASADIMDHLAPCGNVYQAGTLSGNPVAMAAGLATLTEIQAEGFFQQLTEMTDYFVSELQQIAQARNINMQISSAGAMFGIAFSDSTIHDYNDIAKSNITLFNQFFHGMLERGIYLAPSAFEAGFLSSAHGRDEIHMTLSAADNVFEQIVSLSS